MADKQIWQTMIKPVVVLLVICITVGLLLGVTNHFTAPIIAEAERRAANEGRFELLSDADDFEQIEYTGDGIVDFYKAVNGAGYVITATANGYGGAFSVLVAFDADGNIAGIKIGSNNETVGVGSKVANPEFTEQFKGMPAENFTISDIAAISGATISSGAVTNAVNYAINAYNEVVKGVVKEEATPEQICAELLPESGAFTALDLPSENSASVTVETASDTTEHTAVITNAFVAENGDKVVFAEANGYEDHPLTVVAAFDAEGTLIALNVDASEQTQGLGTKVGDAEYTDKFIGMAGGFDDVDNVASATVSSKTFKLCLNTAYNFVTDNAADAADEEAV